jgi:hypothetical protein
MYDKQTPLLSDFHDVLYRRIKKKVVQQAACIENWLVRKNRTLLKAYMFFYSYCSYLLTAVDVILPRISPSNTVDHLSVS